MKWQKEHDIMRNDETCVIFTSCNFWIWKEIYIQSVEMYELKPGDPVYMSRFANIKYSELIKEKTKTIVHNELKSCIRKFKQNVKDVKLSKKYMRQINLDSQLMIMNHVETAEYDDNDVPDHWKCSMPCCDGKIHGSRLVQCSNESCPNSKNNYYHIGCQEIFLKLSTFDPEYNKMMENKCYHCFISAKFFF